MKAPRRMLTRTLPFSSLLLALLFIAAPAMAQQAVTAQVAASDGSSVRGTVSVAPAGDGSRLVVDLHGLMPGVTYQAVLNAGTCAQPGASVSALATLVGDAAGNATGSGAALFRGAEPIAAATLLDGDHVIRITTTPAAAAGSQSAQDVACAPLPRLAQPSGAASGATGVTRLPSTGEAAAPAIESVRLLLVPALLVAAGTGVGIARRLG